MQRKNFSLLLEKRWSEIQKLSELEDCQGVDQILSQIDFGVLPDGGQFTSLDCNFFLEFKYDFEIRQNNAIDRNIPPLLLVSMQKSASVFLAYSISQILNIPVCSLSRHPYSPINGYEHIIETSIKQFSKGGSITHEHFFPTPNNLNRIKENKINRIVLQVRDPRSALVSMCFHDTKHLCKDSNNSEIWQDTARAYCDKNFDILISYLYDFYNSWHQNIENLKKQGIEVYTVDFDEVTKNTSDVIFNILTFFQLEKKIIDKNELEKMSNSNRFNFRLGSNKEWKKFLNEYEIEKIDNTYHSKETI